MTTSKPYHGRGETVAYRRPTVGARVYIATTSAGWSETYSRKQTDAEVAQFLHPLTVDEVLQQFKITLSLKARPENWEDVINFLSQVTNQAARLIPESVAIGFWGQLTVLEHQQGTN